MAPELRKRKGTSLPQAKLDCTNPPAAASDSQKTPSAAARATEKAPKVKRKAADDASPVSSKKQKATKPASSQKKVADRSTEADKVDKAEKTPKADKKAKADKPAKTTEVDKPAKPSKADKAEKPVKAGKTSKLSRKETEAEAAPAATSPEAEQQDDDAVLLLADELESGEEDTVGDTDLFKPGQDVGKIPAISQDVLDAAKPATGDRGVIYIGRIPHGFYEYEMRQYLSQFGPVSRVRLSRNRKTGASKHFAFVEFENASTAEIVTKTMDNYLLFGHILKVKMVPKSQVHEELFKGANRRFKKVPWNNMAGKKLERPRTQSAWETKVEQERATRAKRSEKLKAIGYEFEAPDLKDVPEAVPAVDTGAKAVEDDPANNAGEAKDTPAEVEEEAPAAEAEAEITPAPKTKTSKKKAAKSGRAQKAAT